MVQKIEHHGSESKISWRQSRVHTLTLLLRIRRLWKQTFLNASYIGIETIHSLLSISPSDGSFFDAMTNGHSFSPLHILCCNVYSRTFLPPHQSPYMALFSKVLIIFATVLSFLFSSPEQSGSVCTVNMPCKFPNTTSVSSRSPTMHSCDGSSTLGKCFITSSIPPGFFSTCRMTAMPNDFSISLPSSKSGSSFVPAEFDNMATLSGPKASSAD